MKLKIRIKIRILEFYFSNSGFMGLFPVGTFMYYQSLTGREGDVAILKSPNFTSPDNARLNFYYHMKGEMTGQLSVRAVNASEYPLGSILFRRQGGQGNDWFRFCTALPSNQEMSVHFTATRGTQGNNHIALDDVTIDSGDCPCKFKISQV